MVIKKTKKLLNATLSATLFVVACLPSASWAEFKSTVGLGLQFGGVIGWQGAVQSKHHKLYLSLGAPGLSAGYAFLPANKVSVGVNGFVTLLGGGQGLFLDFHFSGHQRSGWLVGVEIFQSSPAFDLSFNDDDGSDEIRYSASLGYTF